MQNQYLSCGFNLCQPVLDSVITLTVMSDGGALLEIPLISPSSLSLSPEHPVSGSWVISEDISQGDIFEVSYNLPLLVEKYTLNMMDNELLSVSRATATTPAT